MGGRPRKPTNLKILAGNPGKRKLPTEREVEHGTAEKPDWIAKNVDPMPAMVWDELAPSRIALGLLTSVTVEEFAQLCVYVAAFRRNPTGLDGPCRSDLRAKMNAFGFNPSALAKLGVGMPKPREQPKNPFSSLA